MTDTKVCAFTDARITWKDELEYSHDLESEGLRALNKAIELAEQLASLSEADANETEIGGRPEVLRAKGHAGGA
jgi:hypothetical protein